MHPRTFCLGLACALLTPAGWASAPVSDEAVIRQVMDTVIRQTTRRLVDRRTGETFSDSSSLRLAASISVESKFNAWFYQTWLLTDGMRRLAPVLGEPALAEYGDRNLEFIYRHLPYFERQRQAGLTAAPVGDGRLSPIGFHFEISEPWHTGLAPLVVERWAATHDARYEPYLQRISTYLAAAPRTPDGAWYRRDGRLLADDPYMIVPYELRMARATGVSRHFDEAAREFLGTKRLLFDATTRVYCHAWDVPHQQRAGCFWGRGNGWMLLTAVELLSGLPREHAAYREIAAALSDQASGLRRCQDAAGGWHQLLDHPESWVETSSTGMFVYGIARGVNEGWLPPEYAEVAHRGWTALKEKVTPDGDLVDVCASTGVGDANYYLHRARLQGDLHGFGPFLLAASEMLRLQRSERGAPPRLP